MSKRNQLVANHPEACIGQNIHHISFLLCRSSSHPIPCPTTHISPPKDKGSFAVQHSSNNMTFQFITIPLFPFPSRKTKP